jgi:hypothetical protein
MRRSVSWCAQSRDSKATFNNNLMQTWHYTFGPHAPQTQVLCGFLNRPTAATVEDGLDVPIKRPQHADARKRYCGFAPRTSFVDIAILLFLLFAFMQAFQDRRAPWYQHGLIRKPLRKIGVILLHDVERCFVGEIAMVLGK